MSDGQERAYLDRARQYAAVVIPAEDGLFAARAADFAGAVGAGATADEAREELVKGIAALIESLEEMGDPIPQPMAAYSGAFGVRLPKSLHMALAQRAAAEGLSVNATVTYLLTQSLGLQGAVRQPRRRGGMGERAAG
jgi:antitoxin HicB